MFNTTVHKDGDTRIDVKMLPHDTADAARLYGEMVKKAQAEVVGATIREAGARIRAVAKSLTAEKNFANLDTEVRVLFEVNGVDYDIKTTVNGMEREVHEAIGRQIAAQVVMALEKRNGRSLHRG